MKPLTAVVAAFVLSRLSAWALGVRLETGQLAWSWQMLDLPLLQGDYWRSLLYLHSQPPLFNALVGAVYGLAPGAAPALLQALYTASGLVLAVAGHQLLVRLGARPWLAAAAVSAFVVSPGAILYENWLMYTQFVLVLLVVAALSLHRLASSGRALDGACFFGSLAALCLTRALFHLAFLLAAFAVLVLAWRHERSRLRVLLLAFLPAFVLVFALYAKNAVLFGSFGASTWLGMSAYKVSVVQLGPTAIEEMVHRGALSELAATGPFQGLAAYPARYTRTPKTGVPALDDPSKRDGTPNFNHLAYIGISRQYLKDSLAAIRHRPEAYVKAQAQSWLVYFRPATDYGFLGANRHRLAPYVAGYERLVAGRWLNDAPAGDTREGARLRGMLARVGWLKLAAFPAMLAFGAASAWRRRHDRAYAATLGFMVATIAYVAAVGNGLEIGENNRFGFVTSFYGIVLLALGLQAAASRLRLPREVRRIAAALERP